MTVEISKRARRQIERIARWWTSNRPDELADAEQRLRANPEIGPVYARHPTGEVRRILLAEPEHHLYYRYRPGRGELALWGASRGRTPRL